MQMLYKAFYRLFRRARLREGPARRRRLRLIDRRVVDALNALPENTSLHARPAGVGRLQRRSASPTSARSGCSARTTNNFRRNLGWARRAIVSFSYAPLDLITGLALCHASPPSSARSSQIVAAHRRARLRRGFTTLIVLVLFLGGIQLLCLVIIGSYLAHIYEEVKGAAAVRGRRVLNRPGPGRHRRRAPERNSVPRHPVSGRPTARSLGGPEPQSAPGRRRILRRRRRVRRRPDRPQPRRGRNHATRDVRPDGDPWRLRPPRRVLELDLEHAPLRRRGR